MLIATWLKSNTGNIFTTNKLLDDFNKNVQFTSYKLVLLLLTKYTDSHAICQMLQQVK